MAVAGGWNKKGGEAAVDIFLSLGGKQADSHDSIVRHDSVGRLPDKTISLGSEAYDVGAASVASLTYIADNEQLLVLDETGKCAYIIHACVRAQSAAFRPQYTAFRPPAFNLSCLY